MPENFKNGRVLDVFAFDRDEVIQIVRALEAYGQHKKETGFPYRALAEQIENGRCLASRQVLENEIKTRNRLQDR